MREYSTYICDKCGTEFRSKRLALFCESGALPDALEVLVGDKVYVHERYDSWQPDCVTGFKIEPAPFAGFNRGLTDDDEWVGEIIKKFTNTHGVSIRVKKHHQVGKDEDSYSDLFDPMFVTKDMRIDATGKPIPDCHLRKSPKDLSPAQPPEEADKPSL